MEKPYFETIVSDFRSSSCPVAEDASTVRTLDRIVDEIQMGRTTLAEFRAYLQGWIGVNDFSSWCVGYVRRRVL